MKQAVQRLQKTWFTIPSADSSGMEVYQVRPEGPGSWPVVIVLMEIFGVNAHIREITERIAAEGYVAVAPNYYHRTTSNLELGYSEADVAQGRLHKDKTTRNGLLKDIESLLEWLQTSEIAPHIIPKGKAGCIGFCFGGHVAYIAAKFPEIAATASFYGGGIARFSPGGGAPTVTHTPEIKGEILCLFGEEDPLIPHEDTVIIENALKAGGIRHEVVRYSNVGHGFFCNQREDYDASAAEDAWLRVKALFERALH